MAPPLSDCATSYSTLPTRRVTTKGPCYLVSNSALVWWTRVCIQPKSTIAWRVPPQAPEQNKAIPFGLREGIGGPATQNTWPTSSNRHSWRRCPVPSTLMPWHLYNHQWVRCNARSRRDLGRGSREEWISITSQALLSGRRCWETAGKPFPLGQNLALPPTPPPSIKCSSMIRSSSCASPGERPGCNHSIPQQLGISKGSVLHHHITPPRRCWTSRNRPAWSGIALQTPFKSHLNIDDRVIAVVTLRTSRKDCGSPPFGHPVRKQRRRGTRATRFSNTCVCRSA